MNVAAFCVIAFMLTAYVLLDGFDLGVGAVSLFLARTDRERAAAMESIGPFWNGNEVWLIAAGGALFALFPKAYASAFSGFYLPFIVVLWLLMFRGIAMELRDHFRSDLWHQFWDAAFSLSSTLLIVTFGLALGNLLRGLPLDARGYFQGTFGFLLNPYALLVAAFALAALSLHGAIFVAYRIAGTPRARGRAFLRRVWWAVLVLYLVVTWATFAVRGLPSQPWLYVLPVLSLAALVAMIPLSHRNWMGSTFIASSAFLATLLIEAAGSIYPYLLPGYPLGSGGLSIFDGAPARVGLLIALTVTIGGAVAVVLYGSIVARQMAHTVSVE